MSELIKKEDSRETVRWKLLTGTSALALIAYISSAGLARAEDTDRPQVWIELGGQLSRLQDNQELFKPPFLALTPSIFSPPQEYERPPRYGLGESIALTFQPKASDWIFSASVQYGRASSNKHVRQQTYTGPYQKYTTKNSAKFHQLGLIYPLAAKFTDTKSTQTEDRTILDFQVGKDVGLGMFGPHASSYLSLGVRFAQFTSKSRTSLSEDPDWKFNPAFYTLKPFFPSTNFEALRQAYHTYAGTFSADRSFHGIGPSVSWKSSVPFVGNSQNGELTVDFGMNGALLFGRQRAKTHHRTTAHYHPFQTWYYYRYYPSYNYAKRTTVYDHAPPDHVRSHNVIVPNLGGFAGISFKYDNAKVSFGYKADFFFGAMDGGIDVRKTSDRDFYGPFASVSIGLGG